MENDPCVGVVTRERILRIVLLPAPFGPISPTVSPRRISKLTSLRAQNSRVSPDSRRKALRARRASSSRRETYQPLCRRYFFDTRSNRIATSFMRSDHVGEGSLGSFEYQVGRDQADNGQRKRAPDQAEVGRQAVQQDTAVG